MPATLEAEAVAEINVAWLSWWRGWWVDTGYPWHWAIDRGYGPKMLEPSCRESFLAGYLAGAKAEREACVKVVLDDETRDDFPWCGDVREIAAAIRARG